MNVTSRRELPLGLSAIVVFHLSAAENLGEGASAWSRRDLTVQ
jgi:hypothetical protein